MLKHISSSLAIVLLFSASTVAADNGDRDKLFGSWVESGNGSASTWTFSGNGDSFHVTQLDGTAKVADYPCEADGKKCAVKLAGKKGEVSMWFNGTKLVLLETQGPTVVKRRFAVLEQGDTMEMEIIPIVPGGKTETIQFKRAPLSTQSK
jgi:hypothetical protein